MIINDLFNNKKQDVAEGRFVRGPGGVPLDRQGRPVAPKAPKAEPMRMRQWVVHHEGQRGEGGEMIIDAPNFETAWELANEYDLDIIDIKPVKGVAEGSKMARADKLAKAPKPEDQQEYNDIEKYRKDLAQSYNKEPNFGIKDDEEENKWWIDYDLDEGVAEGTGNIGNQIKALYQKIHAQGDDAVEFMYYDSPIFAQYWDEYEGDLDSIIAEVDPGELQIIHDELLSAAEQQGVAEGSFDHWSPMGKDSIHQDRIRSLQNLIAIAKEQGRQLRVQELELALKKLQGVSEDNAGVPVHRIGLTVTDPNHPMVSKRGETIQKTVRVPGADQEKAIDSAIAHYRRKGYKVHDHHYIGTVDQGMAEAFANPGSGSTGTSRGAKRIANTVRKALAKNSETPDQIAARKDFEAQTDARMRQKKKEQGVAEASLGDYRKKATVNKAVAQANKFFDRDDAAKVAAADQTIAKREKGLARADARVKAYTPPAQDAEKMQRDLTAKYPNIDELVRRAELNRDPDYEMADGQAYYAARDAEQNYLKLKQIQRVIQGLNESLNRSHLP